MTKKVKNVLLRVSLEGEGVVNYDSGDQKDMWKKIKGEYLKHNNNQFAKKDVYYDGKDDNGRDLYSYKLKISANALNKALYGYDQSGYTTFNEHLMMSLLATPSSLLRGYTYLSGDFNLKRAKALRLTSATQTNNAVSKMEFFSRSGDKKEKETAGESSDTTIFNKETVGEITYESKGMIDLMQLQFISLSEMHDRIALNPDDIYTYQQYMRAWIPNFMNEDNIEKGEIYNKFYTIKGCENDLPEMGILLNKLDIMELVKFALKKVIALQINRSDAYAKVNKLEYKLVYDGVEDTYDNEDGWLTLSSIKDIDNMDFEPEFFFEEQDTEKSKKLQAKVKEARKEVGNTKKGKKEKTTDSKKK